MNVRELEDLLVAHGMHPPDYVWFGDGMPPTAQHFGIVREDDGWHVYYSERAQHTHEVVFADEHAACTNLLSELGRDPRIFSRGMPSAEEGT